MQLFCLDFTATWNKQNNIFWDGFNLIYSLLVNEKFLILALLVILLMREKHAAKLVTVFLRKYISKTKFFFFIYLSYDFNGRN